MYDYSTFPLSISVKKGFEKMAYCWPTFFYSTLLPYFSNRGVFYPTFLSTLKSVLIYLFDCCKVTQRQYDKVNEQQGENKSQQLATLVSCISLSCCSNCSILKWNLNFTLLWWTPRLLRMGHIIYTRQWRDK